LANSAIKIGRDSDCVSPPFVVKGVTDSIIRRETRDNVTAGTIGNKVCTGLLPRWLPDLPRKHATRIEPLGVDELAVSQQTG